MSYRKFLLKTDWYNFTITDAYKEEDFLVLCFTVDTGEFSYRHVIQKFELSKQSIERLINKFKDAGFVIISDITNLFFTNQFIGLRFKGKVDRHVNGDVIKNVIIELKEPSEKPSYNVLKEKSDSHFYKEKKGRELPIYEGEGLSRDYSRQNNS